jgi:hypothetical protein
MGRTLTIKGASIATMAGIVLAGFSFATAFAQLSGPDRDTFVKESNQTCSEVLQKKQSFSPAQIAAYCTCMADAQAGFTTHADIAYIAEHKAMTEDYKNRILNVVPRCKAAAGMS